MTGVFATQAAAILLQDDLQLDGGIYTAACLGQAYVDRLSEAGFKFETKIIPK